LRNLRCPSSQNGRQPFAVYLYYKLKDIFGKQKTILFDNPSVKLVYLKSSILVRTIHKIGTATEDRVFERFFLPIFKYSI